MKSILGQTFVQWRLYVVNDGGEADPVDRVLNEFRTEFGNRVRVLHIKSSMGMESASNAGLNEARGEFVVIHDDDDTWDPQFLQLATTFLRKNSQFGGVIAHWQTVFEDVNGDPLPKFVPCPHLPMLERIGLYYFCTPMNNYPPITFLYRRSLLPRIGMYRTDLPVLGDWEFNLRFLQVADIGLIPKILASYHLRWLVTEPGVANSVVADSSLHASTLMRLKREWLQGDLTSGHFGLGTLISMACENYYQNHISNAALARIETQLKGNSLSRVAKKVVRRVAKMSPFFYVQGTTKRLASRFRILFKTRLSSPKAHVSMVHR